MARMDLPWAECDNIGDILHVLHDGMDEIAMSRDLAWDRFDIGIVLVDLGVPSKLHARGDITGSNLQVL